LLEVTGADIPVCVCVEMMEGLTEPFALIPLDELREFVVYPYQPLLDQQVLPYSQEHVVRPFVRHIASSMARQNRMLVVSDTWWFD
jgi:hypothetical protein